MGVPIKASLLLVFTLLLLAKGVHAQQQSRITGTVVEARSKQPLQGVTVVVVGTLYAAVTDAEGRFVLGPLPSGPYVVEINALGFRTERRDVEVAAGTEEDLAFLLRPPEVKVETIDAAALERALQPVDEVRARRLGEINAHETGEFLRAVPGNDAARQGALDFEPVIRGLWGHQVGVYVDGVRFLPGSPYGFGTPLSLFDPYAVASLEVIKGPYALTWGGGNLSAIRMTTRSVAPAGTRLRSSFQAGYASKLNAVDAAGSLAGSPGKTSYRVHGAYRTGNDYEDGSGQTIPADFRAVSLRGWAAYRFRTSTRFVLQAGYQDRNALDTPGYVLVDGASEAADVSARFQTAWAVGPIRAFDATASWNRRAQTLADPVERLDEGSPQLLAVEAEQAQVGGRLTVRLVPIKGWTLEVGGDVYSIVHDAVREVASVSPLDPELDVLRNARVTDTGFFASGARVFGRLEANGAVRVDVVQARAEATDAFLRDAAVSRDDIRVTETFISGAFAVKASLSSVWEVSAGMGSVARAADAYERYGASAPSRRMASLIDVTGNPGLDPERNTQADVWVRASYARLELHLNTFARRLSNYITIADLARMGGPPAAAPRYINSKATFYGAEVRAQYALLGEFVTMNVGGSYLWGRDDSMDAPAFGVAPASVVAGGRLTAPASLFFMEGMVRGVFEQSRVAASLGETPTAGYVTADLRLGVTLPRSVSVLVGVDNLFGKTYANHHNTAHALSFIRIAEPGRVFYIRMRYGI